MKHLDVLASATALPPRQSKICPTKDSVSPRIGNALAKSRKTKRNDDVILRFRGVQFLRPD